MPLLDADFAALCFSLLDGSLADFPLRWKNGAVCAPVAVAQGYPGSYRKDDRIIIDQEKQEKEPAKIFFAGARSEKDEEEPGLYTKGGRVLAASAWGVDADAAYEKAYKALEAVHFEGMDFRKDIGRENNHA
ncbi:hypothetical protein FACS189461_3160 [Spirochaetia bacterium]|nr:hypothetical protein FACS189461_3160 [Spirochaetia bacterium]